MRGAALTTRQWIRPAHAANNPACAGMSRSHSSGAMSNSVAAGCALPCTSGRNATRETEQHIAPLDSNRLLNTHARYRDFITSDIAVFQRLDISLMALRQFHPLRKCPCPCHVFFVSPHRLCGTNSYYNVLPRIVKIYFQTFFQHARKPRKHWRTLTCSVSPISPDYYAGHYRKNPIDRPRISEF